MQKVKSKSSITLINLDSQIQASLATTESFLVKPNLNKLVSSVDVGARLDEDVTDVLIEFTDEYVDDIISRCIALCRHRGSKTLTQKDLAFALNAKGSQLVINKNNEVVTNNGGCSESSSAEEIQIIETSCN